MAERKKAKPQQIISGLQPATRTHPVIKLPPKPAKHSRASLLTLLAAFALVVLGMGSLAYSAIPRETTDQSAAGSVKMAPLPSTDLDAPNAPLPGAAVNATPAAQVAKPSFSARIRPANYVETLTIDGKPAQFASVGDLKLPADRPLVVYVVLRTQLDERTEHAWRRAGMFRDEGRTLSPWLRMVTISDREALDNLIDWHVDHIALADAEK